MSLFESLRAMLKSACCKAESKVIGSLDADLDQVLTEKKALQEQVSTLNIQIKTLKESSSIQIPEEILKRADKERESYPIANIRYAGYTIKLKDSILKPEIVVQDFIHVLPGHREWIRSRKLSLKEFLAANPSMEFGEALNQSAFKIWKEYLKSKVYIFDFDLFGVDEQWASLLETWYIRKMDCENSTLEFMALLEAAGFDGILRSFYWNVCGGTFSGFGHSTCYFYDFRDDCYRHFETTLTSTPLSNFHMLPKNKDPIDESNLKDVWWSFNSDVARHTFATASAKKSYKSRDRFRNIIIK